MVGGVQCPGRVEIEQIDRNDGRRRPTALTRGVLVNVGNRGRRGQQHRGHAVLQRRGHPLVVHAELRHRQRNSDEARLKCTQEGDDVVQALRSHNRDPVAGSTVQTQLFGQDKRSPVQLRPGKRLGLAGAGHLGVHENVGGCIRLFGSTAQEQSREG